MTMTWSRLGALDAERFVVSVYWDCPMWLDEEGTMGDPTATFLIHRVRYINLPDRMHHVDVGGTVYDVPPNTPEPTLTI